MTRKIGIYARVSTNKQDTENQLIKLRDYAKIREWTVIDEYMDQAVSGKKASRPDLDRMKKDIKNNKITGVLVWKLDRLGRSTQDLITLLEFFRLHNCAFISYNNNMDTTTAEGRLLFRIIASFAEFEADLISERTKLAFERKSKQAENLGQKIKWGREQKILSDEEITIIAECRRLDISWRKIADTINADKPQKDHLSYSTIRRVFQKGVGKNRT